MRRRCIGACCIDTALDDSRYCQRCKEKAEEKYKGYSRLYEEERKVFDEQYRKFYASKEWKQTRKEVLDAFPLCTKCNKAFATEVHHVIPLKVDWSKRLDKTNLLGWCKPCHSSHELSERNKGQKK